MSAGELAEDKNGFMDVGRFAGSFVVEIGYRQAWPFLGICDNRPTPAQEARLYIDTAWRIEATSFVEGHADDDMAWLAAALDLIEGTINAARVDDDGSLLLTTGSGAVLAVSGEPDPTTIGEAWWLTGWRPA
ncbi:hypothetical protein [Actinoplanes xinjiangensis]|uniref:hypothetical protein n=1 Tax=Actinoplanes xinjiangensis TaxID=512350 RepID=UPI0011B5F00C|nr:hypothetical protein [Actinoplanes xinjiangensis]